MSDAPRSVAEIIESLGTLAAAAKGTPKDSPERAAHKRETMALGERLKSSTGRAGTWDLFKK